MRDGRRVRAESPPPSLPAARRNCATARGFPAAAFPAGRSCALAPQTAEQNIAEPENAVAGKQRDADKHQAETELPSGRIIARKKMRQYHIGHGADERAVKPSIAAQHQDDQDSGGAVEPERTEVHVR